MLVQTHLNNDSCDVMEGAQAGSQEAWVLPWCFFQLYEVENHFTWGVCRGGGELE